VAPGQIQTNKTALKRCEEFLKFMDQTVAEASAGRKIDVVSIMKRRPIIDAAWAQLHRLFTQFPPPSFPHLARSSSP